MIWKFPALYAHFQQLQRQTQLPNHTLLVTDDENIGGQLIAKLLALTPHSVSLEQHPCVFIFRFSNEWQLQKQHLNDLFLWANLASQPNQYRFFYIANLERYSRLFLNRLLKFLEDSPAGVVGYFQTGQPHQLLKTIRSRLPVFVIAEAAPLTPTTKLTTALTQQFFNLYKEAAWNKLLFLLPLNLDNAVFWSWFGTLLSALFYQTKTLSPTELTNQLPLILHIVNYGWQQYLANLRLWQKHNNQLHGVANWILFIQEGAKFKPTSYLK